ncbi:MULTISPECIES: hypothetical protein [Streptomyces]|uniref:hypothetical protein n=1 Tax=Streptomyces TaxID=1883 RepID=UPI00123A6BD6|nr:MULTISPECIES: hypothetical protein [Streptomyces]NEA01285.1 hypothetical protein [Streptomyces sp. SID10116]MYY83420.1 hypothetical protein [Streptomyces sp. SID335]MYZ14740.1 hypothetical protein [Streptomyces sp. SID337]NDZ92129.1 hypothetical protein [Streptomyces sp. SID10115]NEB43065.1 hypothetical protein [Streptomyces sp. SID339]
MSKTTAPEISWARKEDEDWADAVRVRLAFDEEVPVGFADEVLAEARQLVEEAGQPAREVLGDPAAYARGVAAERVSETYRAGIDTRGLRPAERLAAALGSMGFLVFAVFGLVWIQDGLWVGVNWSSVATITGIGVGVSAGCVAFVARAAGLFRGMWWFLAGAALAFAATVALADTLSDERLFRVPAPVLMLVGVPLAVAAFLLPEERINRWFTPARPAGGLSDEQWLRRLDGLLRGRHGMKTAEARAHVEEVRQHLAAAPATIRAEHAFGDVEIYALRLSEGPRRQQRITRQKFYGALASAVFFGVLTVDKLIDPQERASGWVACYVGAFGCAAWGAFSEWRTLRKQRAALTDLADPAAPKP